jgi:hypothetical protein
MECDAAMQWIVAQLLKWTDGGWIATQWMAVAL